MSCSYSLLDEPLIRARSAINGELLYLSLPSLFVAMQGDEIQDFPALRPHQRHPWHSFLVQLAAIAMHADGATEPFFDEASWKGALLALAPDDPEGAAWCLVAPADGPAFMQSPVPKGDLSAWKNRLLAPDELDMLVTSKNHDLKASRMVNNAPDDWLLGLVSLQTQEGVLGAGKYGISRMNGGFASRPALGAVPAGNWGRRWRRDLAALLEARIEIAEQFGLSVDGGIALVWLPPWDGKASLAFGSLDPLYIEVCRRVRLVLHDGLIRAIETGSKAPRIAAKQLSGCTGDPWTPIDVAEAKALSISARGFDYKLSVDLVFGNGKFRPPIAQALRQEDGAEDIVILAQGITRGQGKTEGYHERRIPISPTARRWMLERKTDQLASLAEQRVQAVGKMRSILWGALGALFDNGKQEDRLSDGAKDKANKFVKPFEQGEDARFFAELNKQLEAVAPERVYLEWLLAMAGRAEDLLRQAFAAGPRSGEQRYRARAEALARFHGGLRNPKHIRELAEHYRQAAKPADAKDATGSADNETANGAA